MVIWGIYCANGLAEGTGSYVFATLLFSSFYDRALRHQHSFDGDASLHAAIADSGSNSGSEGGGCIGKECFIPTAAISCASCMLSACLCVWLSCRSRPRYVALYPNFYPHKATTVDGSIQQ